MRSARRLPFLRTVVTSLAFSLVFVPASFAEHQYKVLYSFEGGSDGDYPSGALARDAAGGLYGATHEGGSDLCFHGCGTVFQLVRNPDGRWKKKTLHTFQANNDSTDGSGPTGDLVLDSAGNLYGTTISGGGDRQQCSSGTDAGCGTVFELAPQPDGSWIENILYRFHLADGTAGPSGKLLFDDSGSIFGTAVAGGNCCAEIFGWGGGAAIELVPGPDGRTQQILHSFCSRDRCHDGNGPEAGLIRGPDGDLYGTAPYGGYDGFPCGLGCGVVFKLVHNPDGSWTEKRIHTFKGKDGSQPFPSITFDQHGNIFGTTSAIGVFGYGNVFKLSPQPDGTWKMKVLYNFHTGTWYGSFATKVVLSAEGDIYGTLDTGGYGNCEGLSCGAIYKLSPGGRFGRWQFTYVHKFSGDDGGFPSGDLLLDEKGNLYGVAGVGGVAGYGVVFKVTP